MGGENAKRFGGRRYIPHRSARLAFDSSVTGVHQKMDPPESEWNGTTSARDWQWFDSSSIPAVQHQFIESYFNDLVEFGLATSGSSSGIPMLTFIVRS
eukprot:gene1432-biopygen10907